MNESKVILTPTATIINDYSMGDCPTLEYNFRVYDPLIHKSVPMGMFYDEKGRRLFLPRGVDVDYIMRKLQSSNMDTDPYEYIFKRYHPFEKIQLRMKYGPRDSRQVEALRFMLCEGKYENNLKRSQFAVNLPTGAGKTYCSVATISYLQMKSIIITAQSGILEQWKNAIVEYTGIVDTEICKLEGSATIDRIISGRSKNMHKKIYLVTHATLKSYGDSRGWNNITKLFEMLKIGLKFYDEAHQNFANMCMVDFFTNVYRTYYVTATLKRSDYRENRVYALYMKNVPLIDLFDQDRDPHTKYLAFKFNSLPRPVDISNCKNMYGLNRVRYIDYLMGNENFWMMFDYIFNMIETHGGKALFYIGTNNAILKVKNRILRHYPEYENDIGIYTSLSGENKKAEREKRFILSTTKSAGAGEDIKDLKYSVVLAEPFKSDVLAQQTLGRTRDPFTFYIELVDVGFYQVNNYYNAKRPIFEKYALSTKQTEIPRAKIRTIAQDAYESRINRNNRLVTFNEPRQELVTFAKNGEKQELVTFYDEEGSRVNP